MRLHVALTIVSNVVQKGYENQQELAGPITAILRKFVVYRRVWQFAHQVGEMINGVSGQEPTCHRILKMANRAKNTPSDARSRISLTEIGIAWDTEPVQETCVDREISLLVALLQ